MKIIVMTGIHANLPALQAALAAARQEGYDALYHPGDTPDRNAINRYFFGSRFAL